MANRLEIIDTLESLAIHCRLPILDVEAKSRWMSDWCDDLKDFPVEAIKSACRTWRQGENLKFPTPGQLIPMVRALVGSPTSGARAATAWTWPTDADLAAMSLEERRRNLMIMAHETRSKAGAMDREGTVPRPEWIERAKPYNAEIKRLNELIARGAQRRSEAA